jgi:tRNA A-37 threonylcarbamoyl transferase component Bud32
VADTGRLVGQGRSADIFETGKGRVLRRYRDPAFIVEGEASLMTYAREHGIPVPEIFDASGCDLVMERVDGPSMLDLLGKQPARLRGLVSELAKLHDIVHAVEAPEGLRAPFGPGTSLLHLDLHPGNVIMGERGPVIIDWPNAAAGPAIADNANTWLIMKTSTAPGGLSVRLVAFFGQAFISKLFARDVGLDLADPLVGEVLNRRLTDRNVLPEEESRIKRILERR